MDTAARRVRRLAGGQAIAEHAVLLATLAAVVAGMQLYAKRSLQAHVKKLADQLGSQEDGMREESGDRRNKRVKSGQVLVRDSTVRQTSQQSITRETTLGGGRRRTVNQDETTVGTLGAGGLASHTEVRASD